MLVIGIKDYIYNLLTATNYIMKLTTDEGTHDIDEEFVFDGVTYHLEGTYTNTWDDCERDEQGYDIPNTGDTLRTLELLSATFGDDNEFTVEDMALLIEIEKELDKNY